jgi:hypothetical protein
MDNDDYTIIRSQPRHARHQGVLRPFEGWALDASGVLDRASPGFLRRVLSGSPRFRQSIFNALAHSVLPNPDQFLLLANGVVAGERPWKAVQQDLAESFMAMSPKEIVSATLGEIPDGLAGCLARLGDQPMRHAGDYVRLVGLLTATDPVMKLRAKTLMQLDRLDADLISAALELDPIALIPGILRRVKDGLEARRLNRILAALKLVSSTASDEALRQSLEDRAANFRSHDFAQAWLERCDQPPLVCAELDKNPQFESVSPQTCREIGKKYQNCLGSKAQQLVTGVWGAWVWKPGPLIVCVTKCEEGPLLTGIYAPGNREVPREHARMVKDVLRPLGVLCFTRVDPVEEVRLLTLGRFVDDEFENFGFG